MDEQAKAHHEMMAGLKALQRGAWDTGNMKALALLVRIDNRLERLGMVAEAAAAVYEDTSDEHAWTLLFEALSDTGMLSEGRQDPA